MFCRCPAGRATQRSKGNSIERKRDIRAVADVDKSPCTSLTTLAARKHLVRMRMRLESCATGIAAC